MGGDIRKEFQDESLAGRFQNLLRRAFEQTKKRCVVLVDEYDKPLLETMDKRELGDHNRAVFKGFFSTLKSYDEYLKFVFLTGVTKFSRVSVFSDLNQLRDISMVEEYSGICGITQKELCDNFESEIAEMAEYNEISVQECFQRLKRMYDGYHFAKKSEGVYNPFSLLNALSDRQFSAYWFSTGTPTFLLKKLEEINFDARKFTDGDLYADAATMSDYRAENKNPIPLFYQTGYLTIKDYDRETDTYGLGYPNEEVKYGFLKSLAPQYIHDDSGEGVLDVRNFLKDIRAADTDSLRDRFVSIFSRLPYVADEKWVERDFQNVIYIVFMLLGQFVRTEIHSSKGRADCVVETKDYVYIFEFKRDKTANEALRQIKDKGYAKPYAADKRQLIKIGANYNSKDRTLDGWEVG